MEISDIAATALAMQQAQLASNVQMAVLKRSMQIEAATVLTLLEGAAASNPPHLGNLVDTTA